MLRRAALSLAMLLVSTSAPGALAAQEQTLSVQGEITIGTEGGPRPEALLVQVLAVTEAGVQGAWEAQMDQDGRYRVDGISRMDGATYVVAADYSETTYVEPVELTGEESVVSKGLTIYESVSTDPGLRFEQSAVVISSVDATLKTVRVLEIHSIVNPTDRTFVPHVEIGGPAGLLLFPLPAHASDLTAEFGLEPSQMQQIDLGFASLSPVIPGRTEMAFSYLFPYSGSDYQIDRSIRYPIDALRVLAPTPGPTIASDQLEVAETATIGEQEYQTLHGGPFAPGGSVRLTVNGLPTPGGPLSDVPPAAPVAVGAAAGLAAIFVAWRRTHPAARDLEADDLQEDLIQRIAALDAERQEGRLTEAEYMAARQKLVEELLTSGGQSESQS
ncbi:MAG: hypothetical protein GEU73_04375 [Chloroflexi bacterium]|nr:hypothetical protein [Chloroflexota bacterium]